MHPTDNGGEYSGPFDEYCRQHGIRHQKTPPKTPQLNGLAERMNRTLVERNLMFRIEFGQIMKSLMITCVSLDARLLCTFRKYERSKLDAKTRPCVFIGYGQDELGYRFYDPVQKKLMDDDVHEQSPVAEAPPNIPLRGLPETDILPHDEMKSLHENHSFELVKLPKGKRALKNRWVYRVKQEEHTSQPRYKARLVVKGFGLAASLDLEIEQMDVKTAFLHGTEAVKFSDDDFVILLLYVDDILIVGRNVSRIDKLKKQLSKSFSMKDLGPTKKILVLVGYTDSDMVGDVDNRRSTSGYLMTFLGGVVSWQSRLQKCVALSTTEAEYIVAIEACKELLWMKRFIHELGFKQQRYVVYCDNQSVIHLSKNSTFHARSKHIDVRYHWMRDALNDNLFELEKIHTDHNGSDMLTKSLPREKLEVCCSIAGWRVPPHNRKGRFVGFFLMWKAQIKSPKFKAS
ncbi:Retrovirus-related Pol polyprotein from transposon TNT 1-94 [Vitis vinifera]|uniref:Retrovirus-related Pol polyprotein from transposon TNT 1-94 n=1 Tax=Vitis vinifera TaxID=29760 RepID=A0A438CGQ1_VITVI|nr:Retrovirus-related Pol polyprotein from transposon TNT 1-94 [Vitis vinifera]